MTVFEKTKKRLKTASVVVVLAAIGTPSFANEAPLYSWWNPSTQDNYVTTDKNWSMPVDNIEWSGRHIANGRSQNGYTLYRLEGMLFQPQARQRPGTVPLYTWYNADRGDFASSSNPRSWAHGSYFLITPTFRNGPRSTSYRREGYELRNLEGYLYDPHLPQPPRTVPLFSWWHPERGDNFTTSDPRWSMPVADIRWNNEMITNGPLKEGYRLYRLEGYVNLPQVSPALSLRARVENQHGSDYSRAAVNIEAQLGDGVGQVDLSDTGHRIRLHGAGRGGTSTHYQGVGFLRDATVEVGASSTRYRRAVLSYNFDDGLMISSMPIDHGVRDGVTAWDDRQLLSFKGIKTFFDIRNEASMGAHDHPGGLQSHGDMMAIAMEQPQFSHQAAVYFVKVDGLTPSFVTSLPLGSGGAPSGLDIDSAAASGFLKLETGYLVAISGASHGTAGIWFYKTSDNQITANTRWSYIDFWTPDQMPNGVCDIDDGKHSTACYVGAGGGISLIANDNGSVYLMATTGTDGGGKDDEYAQLYRVSINERTNSNRIQLSAVWSGKKKLGRLATKKQSMRWSGAVQTTANGRLILLNTERRERSINPKNETNGVLRIAE